MYSAANDTQKVSVTHEIMVAKDRWVKDKWEDRKDTAGTRNKMMRQVGLGNAG